MLRLGTTFNADSTELCTVLLPGKYLYAVRDYRLATPAPRGVDTGTTGVLHGYLLAKTAEAGARSGREPSAAAS
jgi:hypothetical protein